MIVAIGERTPAATKAIFDHPIAVTLVLLAALGGVFIKGFREAVGLGSASSSST
jgi:hypothetical protein